MISSGNLDFDGFLGHGFEKKLISLVYGPSASGKTTLCLQAALEVAKKGRVLFLLKVFLSSLYHTLFHWDLLPIKRLRQ